MPTGISPGFAPRTVSDPSATVGLDRTVELLSPGLFVQVTTIAVMDSIGAAFTAKYELKRTNAIEGCIWRIKFLFEATVNPTAEIYDDSVLGTKLKTLQGAADNANILLFTGLFTGGAWTELKTEYVIS